MDPNLKANKTFFVVPKKAGSSPFFEVVKNGCQDQAKRIGVTCEFIGPPEPDANAQAVILRDLIKRKVDGIAVSVVDEKIAEEVIAEAHDAGIPVVTFDSDAPRSPRLAYIGTDNHAFGRTLGKLLQKLRPEGGYYGIISDSTPNIISRVEGVRSYLRDSPWKEVSNSPSNCYGSVPISLDQMEAYSRQQEVSAVISVGGWPMFDASTTRWQNIVDANRGVTYVNADTLPRQVQLLQLNYVDGLAGQVPYQMGVEAMNVLLAHTSSTVRIETEILGTSVMEMVRVPLDLPPVEVNSNHIGPLRFVGYSLFGIIAVTAFLFGFWTMSKRDVRVVRASQPLFLCMICLGALIMGSSVIPLSMDDSFEDGENHLHCRIICMSIPWLSSIGFTIIFSALFSKTWRINKIFHNRSTSSRMRVSEQDVMIPFLCLLVANVILLVCWTILAPLQYVRRPHQGTDVWNRVISTFGSCKNKESVPYACVMGIINLSALMIANWQAYEARTIQSEFAESRYIAIVMASMLQACISGVPILFLVRELPQAFYLVLVILIFIICMAILLLIFVPKIQYERRFRNLDPTQRRQSLVQALQGTQPNRSLHSFASAGTDTSRLSKVFSAFRLSMILGGRSSGSFEGADYNIGNSATRSSEEPDDGSAGLLLGESLMISWESPPCGKQRPSSIDWERGDSVRSVATAVKVGKDCEVEEASAEKHVEPSECQPGWMF